MNSARIAGLAEGDQKGADMPKFTPWLWFDTEGEAAASYVSIFPRSRITEISRYGSAGPLAEGTVMTVSFELDGQQFVALNGGPEFTFNEAISFQVDCKDQDEVDLYWSKLAERGEERPCGWLKDKFGLSWQIVPAALPAAARRPRSREGAAAGEGDAQHEEDEIEELERAAAAA
jgi:predicted 3-demethylubiquinone-9 3-methyltransferase (glyoxalase superfamily)